MIRYLVDADGNVFKDEAGEEVAEKVIPPGGGRGQPQRQRFHRGDAESVLREKRQDTVDSGSARTRLGG